MTDTECRTTELPRTSAIAKGPQAQSVRANRGGHRGHPRGRMIIVVDDEDRENEGDLTMAAAKVTPEAINFMAKHGRGLICLRDDRRAARQLEIPLEVSENTSRCDTAMCVSIDAKRGHEHRHLGGRSRARRCRWRSIRDTTPRDLARPGHVFPLRARDRRRAGARRATPRRPSIWRGSPGCYRPASSAKS